MWAVINTVSLVVQGCSEKKIKLRSPDASPEDLNYLPGPAMASVGDPHLLHLGSSSVRGKRLMVQEQSPNYLLCT